MNWKKSLSEFLIFAGISFAIFYLSGWKLRTPFFNSHNLILSGLPAIATGLIAVGLQGLRTGGHQKARRILRNFLVVWYAIFVAFLVGAMVLHQTNVPDTAVDAFLYIFLAPCLIPLPLALYLNHKLHKSNLQPTTTNAS